MDSFDRNRCIVVCYSLDNSDIRLPLLSGICQPVTFSFFSLDGDAHVDLIAIYPIVPHSPLLPSFFLTLMSAYGQITHSHSLTVSWLLTFPNIYENGDGNDDDKI